jgi:membrane-associated protease RseP (regulator of RpoE activity)
MILAIQVLSSCANQHALSYKPNVDIGQIPNPEVINGDPYVLGVDDFAGAYNKALSEGYVLFGMSVFQGEMDENYNTLQLARDKGASLVIKASRFSHTEYSTYYLPLTTTSTYSTVGYGTARSNVYNSNNSYVGSVNTAVSGTATTTGQNTNWVPMQTSEQIFYQATALFVKSNVEYTLGAYYRDLNINEQKEMMTNKGVLVTHVIKKSPAYDFDLIPGDVILGVNQKKNSDEAELKDFLSKKEAINEIIVNRAKLVVSLKMADDSRAISSIKEIKIESNNPGSKKND